MPLACGCEVQGGAPVSREIIKAHYKHTLEALIFWELILRRGFSGEPKRQDTIKLAEARIALLDAIKELYPEVESIQ